MSESNLQKEPAKNNPVVETEKSQEKTVSTSPNNNEPLKNETRNESATINAQEAAILVGLEKKIDLLQSSFEEKLKFDLSKENQINNLHSELQAYKNGLMFKILKPLVLDLITIHDNIGKIATEHRKTASEIDVKLYESFQTDIEDTLYRYGFEAFSTGEDVIEFDSKRQRVAKTIPSSDALMDRKIAERLRKGFTYEGLVIRPEIISAYTYKPTPNS